MPEYWLSGTTSTAIDTRRVLWAKWLRKLRATKGDTSAANEVLTVDSLRTLRVKVLRVYNL